MKKIFCFIFLTVILSPGVNTAKGQTFRAGFTLGVVRTDVDGMDTRDHDNDFHKMGFMAGGIINSKLGKKNMFQMELNYVQKGTVQPPDSMNRGYYKLGIDYIEVPFILRHRIHFTKNETRIDRFDLEIGASIGRMVRHNWILDNYPAPLSLDKMNMTDASILIGFNYNFNSHTCLNFRYTNSVIPVLKHDAIPPYLITYYFNTGNNMVFQVSIKVIFGGTAEKALE